jgi:transcription initiation factor IIE alpha subunit
VNDETGGDRLGRRILKLLGKRGPLSDFELVEATGSPGGVLAAVLARLQSEGRVTCNVDGMGVPVWSRREGTP